MELTVDEVRLEDPDFYFEGRRQTYERLHTECPVFYYRPLDVLTRRGTASCAASPRGTSPRGLWRGSENRCDATLRS